MRLLTIALTGFLFFAGIQAAKADYFVWRDAHTGLSLSFPDTWQVVTNQNSDGVTTVMAPAGRGNAQCKVRARDDRRYMVYPVGYSSDIQKVAVSADFWDRYIREYEDAYVIESHDTAGLGRGYAGYALAAYHSEVPGPYMDRRALMFASLYNGDLFILECSAHRDAFHEWKGLFLSIADSIDFQKAHHEIKTGNYRDFMEDDRIQFRDIKGEYTDVY